MVGTQCFHCWGPGSIPSGGTKILKAAWCNQKQKQKQKNKECENVGYKYILSMNFLSFSYVQKVIFPDNPICFCTYVSEI